MQPSLHRGWTVYDVLFRLIFFDLTRSLPALYNKCSCLALCAACGRSPRCTHSASSFRSCEPSHTRRRLTRPGLRPGLDLTVCVHRLLVLFPHVRHIVCLTSPVAHVLTATRHASLLLCFSLTCLVSPIDRYRETSSSILIHMVDADGCTAMLAPLMHLYIRACQFTKRPIPTHSHTRSRTCNVFL